MLATFLTGGEYQIWSQAKSIIVGVSLGLGQVVAHVGISMESGCRVRVDIQADAGYSCFQDVRCLGNVVYIGYGECLFVVQPQDGIAERYSLDGYFGHLYSAEELEAEPPLFSVLVASASELLSFSLAGALQWRTGGLGIDGVTVESVQGGAIRGSGEWDPPGGWEAFCFSALTGAKNVA